MLFLSGILFFMRGVAHSNHQLVLLITDKLVLARLRREVGPVFDVRFMPTRLLMFFFLRRNLLKIERVSSSQRTTEYFCPKSCPKLAGFLKKKFRGLKRSRWRTCTLRYPSGPRREVTGGCADPKAIASNKNGRPRSKDSSSAVNYTQDGDATADSF